MLDAIENGGIENAAGTVSIRRLKAEDVPAAVRLTQAARWPHTAEDWRLHLQLGHGWVANDSGTLLGTAMTWSYGQAARTNDPDYIPRKHTVIVQPGAKISYLVTADAYGRWAYHCHLLYHMPGMMREVRVA
jgi:FtsP/CotA-like multicopper oxidase with cupredoxin domain